MPLSKLKEDEEAIQLLEELDNNFSSIRISLREMRMKIARMAEQSKQLVRDCTPWIRFFEMEAKAEFSPLSELQLNSLRYQNITNSPDNFNSAPPKNPFIEIESSELLNNSILKSLKYTATTESSSPTVSIKSSPATQENSTNLDSEGVEYEIKPFDTSQIPQLFQNENDLFELYKFIEKGRTVTVEAIVRNFSEIPPEKLEILISLLCRKQFIKQKNGKLTIDK